MTILLKNPPLNIKNRLKTFSLPLFLLFSTYWVLPESPRWLLTHGQAAEAEKTLRNVAAENGKPLHPGRKNMFNVLFYLQ